MSQATVSISQSLDWAKQQLQDSETPGLDARVLLCHCLSVTPTYLMTWPERTIDADDYQRFVHLVGMRKQGIPVAHITGVREFWSLPFEVSEHTLIPRPDTEALVEHALQLNLPTQANVLDLGTGTGAIALALAYERPDWQVDGVDVKPEAVALAQRNQQNLELQNVNIQQSNWFQSVSSKRYDLIISNPPYVESDSEYLTQGDVRFEPLSALTSGIDGLDDIQFIITQAPNYLLDGAWLLIEHGYQQGSAVETLFLQQGFGNLTLVKDLADRPRATCAQIC